ncbi:MAG: hypothetical protein KGJ86_09355 [Chloroflexota bacterium]|nr:hypothetical protein [Chloroflexota bacterium]
MWTRTWIGAFIEAAIWFLVAVILLANVPTWAFNLTTENFGLKEFWGDLVAGIIAGVTLVIYVGAAIARIRWGEQKEREATAGSR